MKTGLFGGTFNPVHLGHLRAAEEIRELFALDRVIFVPAYIPPHKLDAAVPASHRYEMVRLAAADNPCFEVSDIELQRRGTSYSCDTIGHFSRQCGPEAELFFIIGLDAFQDIHTWRHYPDFFSSCNFIVMNRPGQYGPQPGAHALDAHGDLFTYNHEQGWYEHGSGRRIYFCQVTPLAVSSTAVRRALHEARSVKYLVPDAIARYIRENGLY